MYNIAFFWLELRIKLKDRVKFKLPERNWHKIERNWHKIDQIN